MLGEERGMNKRVWLWTSVWEPSLMEYVTFGGSWAKETAGSGASKYKWDSMGGKRDAKRKRGTSADQSNTGLLLNSSASDRVSLGRAEVG